MKTFFFASFLAFSLLNCRHENLDPSIPACIQGKIDELKAQPKTNPPFQVTRYIYAGTTVYYVPSPCCDQFNYVYDSNCRVVCAPDGGIAGTGDGACKDFRANAKFDKVVWTDER
jgi:hypothetical protein